MTNLNHLLGIDPLSTAYQIDFIRKVNIVFTNTKQFSKFLIACSGDNIYYAFKNHLHFTPEKEKRPGKIPTFMSDEIFLTKLRPSLIRYLESLSIDLRMRRHVLKRFNNPKNAHYQKISEEILEPNSKYLNLFSLDQLYSLMLEMESYYINPRGHK